MLAPVQQLLCLSLHLLPDALEHLEKLILLLVIHPDSGVFDLSQDQELVPSWVHICVISGFLALEHLEIHVDGSLVLVELAGVREHIVEDLLVEVNIQKDSHLLEGLDCQDVSIDILVQDELQFLLTDLVSKQLSEVLDYLEWALHPLQLWLVLALLD